MFRNFYDALRSALVVPVGWDLFVTPLETIAVTPFVVPHTIFLLANLFVSVLKAEAYI